MRGQRVRFRVSPDGTVGMVDDDGATREVAQVVSLMPAAFPKGAIRVGESWIREMPLPAGLQLGAQLSGKLHVDVPLRFADARRRLGVRLDARRDAAGDRARRRRRARCSRTGMVNGTMLVDRKRGWLTESWFNIVVSSIDHAAAVDGRSLSMHMQMRITQHMRRPRTRR